MAALLRNLLQQGLDRDEEERRPALSRSGIAPLGATQAAATQGRRRGTGRTGRAASTLLAPSPESFSILSRSPDAPAPPPASPQGVPIGEGVPIGVRGTLREPVPPPEEGSFIERVKRRGLPATSSEVPRRRGPGPFPRSRTRPSLLTQSQFEQGLLALETGERTRIFEEEQSREKRGKERDTARRRQRARARGARGRRDTILTGSLGILGGLGEGRRRTLLGA